MGNFGHFDVNVVMCRVWRGVIRKYCHKYYFFKIVQLSTCTKPILKEVFINYIQMKVIQFPNNANCKRKLYIFINTNDKRVYL